VRIPSQDAFDGALFAESLSSMHLEGMTECIALVLLAQTTRENGEMMSFEELSHMVAESKYSSDGRLSRVARASRSLPVHDVPALRHPSKLPGSRNSSTRNMIQGGSRRSSQNGSSTGGDSPKNLAKKKRTAAASVFDLV